MIDFIYLRKILNLFETVLDIMEALDFTPRVFKLTGIWSSLDFRDNFAKQGSIPNEWLYLLKTITSCNLWQK